MSTLIIGDRIIRTSDPILRRKQAAQGMQQASIGSLSGRTTDDDRGRQAREIQRDAGVETITRDSDRDYDENTERLIAQAKAERGIIDEPKKTGIFGIDFSNVGLPAVGPVFGAIQGLGRHQLNPDVKIQKTTPSEGYHVWHCEHGDIQSSTRVILVMLYLNDVEEGGETEFLYQSRRIEPKMGRLVFCPAFFTHTHRGNPPLRGSKYMMNGWLQYYHEIT